MFVRPYFPVNPMPEKKGKLKSEIGSEKPMTATRILSGKLCSNVSSRFQWKAFYEY